MKKIIFFVIPLLASAAFFLGLLFFFDRDSRKGALQVTSDPKSKVFLNNKLIGDTPFCACEVSQMIGAGEYSFKIVPDDSSLKPFEEKISINKSALTVVDRSFSKEGDFGSVVTLLPLSSKKDIEILVESIPSKGNVFLDNSPVGTTTLLLKNVGEGDHDIRLTKDGFKEKLVKIKTTLGYRVFAKLFLGTSDLLNNSVSQSESASSSAKVNAEKVLILDTPTGFLRVRESNSVSSLEIGKVSPGETYELLDEQENWLEIQFNDRKGWISSQYAKKKNE